MSTRNRVKFKEYAPNQAYLFPPSVEDFIPEHHPVRLVNQVIDRVNTDGLLAKYKGGGTTSYHPKMLLKVLVYAYLNNIYSSRKIEEGLQQNVFFMWISGMNKPDHNTINRFRSERLRDTLKPIFREIVLLLAEQGVVGLKEVYVDGTKIEANANKYTFVWGGAIKTSKERIKRQLDELWAYAQKIAGEEMSDTAPLTYEQIDSQKVSQAIEQINKALSGKEIESKKKQKLNYAKKHWPSNLERYQAQQQEMGTRKNYSKTDPDATFMRMKEDHMKNGQLKPGYNLQLSTNNQIIVNYTVHQTSTDVNTLEPHLDEYKLQYGKMPDKVIADAGYGSQENYEYLKHEHIQSYVKYPYFDREQSRLKNKNPFSADKLYYDKEKDCFYCPMGQCMSRVGQHKRVTDNGFEQQITVYQTENCQGCSIRGACHKQKGNRRIEVNHRLREYKLEARENLLSEEGVKHRKQRVHDTEPVFGNIKYNKKFKRFNLRSLPKVEIETGLLALAHNLKKIA